jgi:trans-aconitate methyltransferase
LAELGRANRKPYFAPVTEFLTPFFDRHPESSVLDIGCSLGGFLAALHGRWPRLTCTGVDVQESVIEQSRKLNPELSFETANVLEPDSLPGLYDVVTMLGVHSLFDEPLVWLDGAVRACAPGGRIIVFGLFNPENVDVLTRVRWTETSQGWQTGWNVWSRHTVDTELLSRGLDWTWTWTEVLPAYEVDRWSEDPLHTWTAEVEGVRCLINGTQIVHRQAILEIRREVRAG